MFKPDWLGKIDWKKGLYASKNREKEEKEKEEKEKEEKEKEEKEKEEIQKKEKEEFNTIISETHFNYNKFSNLDIPYYNETIDYMNSKVSKKYDNNYYHLLDKIGSVSRFLLKGNDYYKSYISKNANKYYNDKESNDRDSNHKNFNNSNNNDDDKQQYTKLSLNIKYQEIEKPIINDDQYDD